MSQLPMKAYEVVYRGAGDIPTTGTVETNVAVASFVEIVNIKIESEEAERIGVEDIMKHGKSHQSDDINDHSDSQADVGTSSATRVSKSQAIGKSEFANRITEQTNAVEMFRNRLVIVRDYIKSVRAGEIQADHSLLRQINACIIQLSRNTDHDPNYQELGNALDKQQFEALTAYLAAALTKGQRLGLDLRAKHQFSIGHKTDSSTPTGEFIDAL
ncbi:Mov34/MPN/PAD-1 family protein [Sugiyamaella lignohabitans]|uniref:Mov34/MPN/PAD-1 family protein n=1 Tax=Sugiyamaella lignohabitans TaxID=796027 RepID=A0A167D103_9ASCO|nr:Mov34/MPN/PAD-1 family protein [Sugiyamaella lignohabitans]ANB12344.1 Mov34/MPN/PAD-1 family protein [Sugiyamaella lignohabitans]